MARKRDRGDLTAVREIEAAIARLHADVNGLDTPARREMAQLLGTNLVANGVKLSKLDFLLLEEFAQGKRGSEDIERRFGERVLSIADKLK